MHVYLPTSVALTGLKVSVVTVTLLLGNDVCIVIFPPLTTVSSLASLHSAVGVSVNPGTASTIQPRVNSDPATAGVPVLFTVAMMASGGTVCV